MSQLVLQSRQLFLQRAERKDRCPGDGHCLGLRGASGDRERGIPRRRRSLDWIPESLQQLGGPSYKALHLLGIWETTLRLRDMGRLLRGRRFGGDTSRLVPLWLSAHLSTMAFPTTIDAEVRALVLGNTHPVVRAMTLTPILATLTSSKESTAILS